MDSNLDSILHSRAAPPQRPELEDRILMVVLERDENRISLWGQIQIMFQMFFLVPRPAYILAAVVLAGIVVGWDSDSIGALDQISTYELAGILDVQEQFETGEFL